MDGGGVIMRDLTQSRIASGLVVVAGAWLLFTPLVISITGAALVSLFITGGVMVLAGLIQMFWMNTLPSWVNALAAIWLFISAFAFTVSTATSVNEVIVALVVLILASWDSIEANEVRQERHHHLKV